MLAHSTCPFGCCLSLHETSFNLQLRYTSDIHTQFDQQGVPHQYNSAVSYATHYHPPSPPYPVPRYTAGQPQEQYLRDERVENREPNLAMSPLWEPDHFQQYPSPMSIDAPYQAGDNPEDQVYSPIPSHLPLYDDASFCMICGRAAPCMGSPPGETNNLFFSLEEEDMLEQSLSMSGFLVLNTPFHPANLDSGSVLADNTLLDSRLRGHNIPLPPILSSNNTLEYYGVTTGPLMPMRSFEDSAATTPESISPVPSIDSVYSTPQTAADSRHWTESGREFVLMEDTDAAHEQTELPSPQSCPQTRQGGTLRSGSSDGGVSEEGDDIATDISSKHAARGQLSFSAKERKKRREDRLLLHLRFVENLSYKEIKIRGGFKEAESTLRGRVRALINAKEDRVRKPKWDPNDIVLLQRAVARHFQHNAYGGNVKSKQPPWQKISEWMRKHGSSYKFSPRACRAKYDEITGES